MRDVGPSLYDANDFEAFFQRYLALHASRSVRRAHAVGTATAGATIALAVLLRSPALALVAPAADYLISQASHRLDGTRTQPWRRPTWHLRAELRLFEQTVGELLEGVRRRRA